MNGGVIGLLREGAAIAAFLDSPASGKYLARWIENPRTEIQDYARTKPEQYKSWNDFFVLWELGRVLESMAIEVKAEIRLKRRMS